MSTPTDLERQGQELRERALSNNRDQYRSLKWALRADRLAWMPLTGSLFTWFRDRTINRLCQSDGLIRTSALEVRAGIKARRYNFDSAATDIGTALDNLMKIEKEEGFRPDQALLFSLLSLTAADYLERSGDFDEAFERLRIAMESLLNPSLSQAEGPEMEVALQALMPDESDVNGLRKVLSTRALLNRLSIFQVSDLSGRISDDPHSDVSFLQFLPEDTQKAIAQLVVLESNQEVHRLYQDKLKTYAVGVDAATSRSALSQSKMAIETDLAGELQSAAEDIVSEFEPLVESSIEEMAQTRMQLIEEQRRSAEQSIEYSTKQQKLIQEFADTPVPEDLLESHSEMAVSMAESLRKFLKAQRAYVNLLSSLIEVADLTSVAHRVTVREVRKGLNGIGSPGKMSLWRWHAAALARTAESFLFSVVGFGVAIPLFIAEDDVPLSFGVGFGAATVFFFIQRGLKLEWVGTRVLSTERREVRKSLDKILTAYLIFMNTVAPMIENRVRAEEQRASSAVAMRAAPTPDNL